MEARRGQDRAGLGKERESAGQVGEGRASAGLDGAELKVQDKKWELRAKPRREEQRRTEQAEERQGGSAEVFLRCSQGSVGWVNIFPWHGTTTTRRVRAEQGGAK